MPYLSPVNKVATVKDGHAWKIFARTGDKVIILTYATDTWIGVKAGNYWIAIHTCSLSLNLYLIYAGVNKATPFAGSSSIAALVSPVSRSCMGIGSGI